MQTEGHSRNALPPGTVLNGAYRVEAEVGQGGFGIVYRAQHTELGYAVAIKEYLPAELALREDHSVHPRNADCHEPHQEGMRRFLEEAKQLVAFRNHPSIVSCRDFFRANGTAYLVMDYEEGLPLSELLQAREEEGRPFQEEDLRKVMVPLLEGLARVHAAGVLHRDIKPGNILVRREDERPVLIDFGAAKQNFAEHTKSLAPLTEGYAAIEQVGEGKLGPWTDLYAVGAVMWRMVAGGKRPWEPPNPVKVESRTNAMVRGEADPMPSARELGRGRFSERVLGAIDQCLELKEADRVQGCEELLGLLRADRKTAPRASEPRPAEEAPSQPPGEAGLPGRHRQAEAQPSRAARKSSMSWKWMAAALTMLALAAILGLILSDPRLHENPDRDRSQPSQASSEPSNGVPGASKPFDPPQTGREMPKVKLERLANSFLVETEPKDARVRILNIVDRYRPGMILPGGKYHVEVSAPGYETRQVWLEHELLQGVPLPFGYGSGSSYRIELDRTRREGPPSRFSTEPACAGQPEGTECWQELANQPRCYVWDDYHQTDQTMTWTGECSDGLAHGEGTLTWVIGNGKDVGTGRLQDGKRHGDWVERFADGTVQEGPYVDGKMHGRWVLRGADGSIGEGPVVDGKMHGQWVIRWADGDVQEGPYVDDKKHGRWVLRGADGDRTTGRALRGRQGARSMGHSLGERDCCCCSGRALCGRREARPLGRALGRRDCSGRFLCEWQEARPLGPARGGWDRVRRFLRERRAQVSSVRRK